MAAIHAVILIVSCFVVYSNNYDHDFHLDSGHVLLENPKVRSLRHIPAYFVDPGTFTALRANADYRPVLQVSYALNYWLGAYDMWWWHFTQIGLHALCVIGLYFFCLRVTRMAGYDHLEAPALWTAFFASAVFALHPTASGVVNYLSARSSLLTAVFLIGAILAYTRVRSEAREAKTMWLTAFLFALAVFSKVEAIGCVGVFLLYDVWQTAVRREHASGFVSDVLATINLRTLRRLWPVLVVAGAYMVVRSVVMADFNLGEASRRSDVSSLEYLQTQVVAWGYYLRHWFVPLGLVADQGNYHVYRSLLEGTLLLAIGLWCVAGAFLVSQWKTRPYLLFLTLSALALISPTSSIVPLAEMVNEHRPYLPLAILSLAWMVPLGQFLWTHLSRTWLVRSAAVAGAVAILGGLGALTFERNIVYATVESYWADVVAKAPSARAYMNYGLVFMARGDYETAQEYYEKSLAYAPYWYSNHINLGIVNRELGNQEAANRHFNLAVEYDQFAGTALMWRARHHLESKDYAAALADFEKNLGQSLRHYENYKGMATSCAGLGDARRCHAHTIECLKIDPAQTSVDIVEIAGPYFLDPARYQAGIDFFQLLEADLPDTWWVYANMGNLAARLGQEELADSCAAKVEALRASDPG